MQTKIFNIYDGFLEKPAFVLLYWFAWIIFFELFRLVFLFANYNEAVQAGLGTAFQSLWYGLRMDMSAAAYVLLPVCFFVLLSNFFLFFRRKLIYIIYTAIVLFLILILQFADLGIFQAWGTRLDATPLKYLADPKEAWASVNHLPVFTILAGFIVLYLLLLFLANRLLESLEKKLQSGQQGVFGFFTILFLTALCIIPLRGGLQLAPLNQSSVYFSQNNFANQAAINAPWNFLRSLSHYTDAKTNPFVYLDPKEAILIRDSLFTSANHTTKILEATVPKPNVIFLIWESFTEKVTHLERDGIPVTPRFNELKKEGIYFSNIYAAGDRTDKGVVAVLSGYPAQPTTSIVKTPEKSSKLPTIGTTLAQQGYNTAFYYGGELEFANMKAYLLSGGFKKFTSKQDFASKDQNSKWGAHDGVVMQKLVEDLKTEAQPFFCTWLTLSSHEPFEVPVESVIPGTDNVSLFLNSLHYTDAIVYDFVQQCKRQPWWKNTLIVIMADHGHRTPATGKKIDDFKMPVLFLGGALNQQGKVEDKIGSQADIPATVLAQLNIPSNSFVWSKNMLDSTVLPWAYFCFNNGYGFVQPGNYYIFDNVGKKPIEQNGILFPGDVKKGKAIQQLSFQDYLDK